MSFILSKVIWALLKPGTLLFLAAATSLLLQRKSPANSRALLAVVVLALGALVLCPIGPWLLRPLESHFPVPVLGQSSVNGIVVLGGALDAAATERVGMPVINDAAERLTAFVALARRYPKAKLIFSGGSGGLRNPDIREADQVVALLDSLGLDPSRVVFERDSRNILENAERSLAVAKPEPAETWLLVTSAWHMPRAMGCFTHAGWKITAYPVDYRSYSLDSWFMFQPDQQLDMATTALREWAGLIGYRLMGRIDNFMPSAPGISS